MNRRRIRRKRRQEKNERESENRGIVSCGRNYTPTTSSIFRLSPSSSSSYIHTQTYFRSGGGAGGTHIVMMLMLLSSIPWRKVLCCIIVFVFVCFLHCWRVCIRKRESRWNNKAEQSEFIFPLVFSFPCSQFTYNINLLKQPVLGTGRKTKNSIQTENQLSLQP